MIARQPSGDAPSSMPPPLGVALLGFGFAGRIFHAPFIHATPGLALRVVGSRQAALVHEAYPDVRCIADPHEAITQPDVDLVVVATPNDSHAPLAEAALRAGRHVVCDKPFTVTLDEARHVTAVARECDRRLSVFQNRRYDSDFLGVAQAVREGRIGEIVELRSEIGRWRPQVRDRWRERAGPGAGLWYDLGPHLVDQALCLFGLPDAVSGDLAVQRGDGQIDDWAHVVLHFGAVRAVRAVLHASMLVAGGSHRFTVHGDRGSLVKARIDQQEAQSLGGIAPGSDAWGVDDDPLVVIDGEGGAHSEPAERGDQTRYYAGVRDAILGVAPNPVTPIEALAVMAVIEAAAQSSREHRVVLLSLSDHEREAYADARRHST